MTNRRKELLRYNYDFTNIDLYGENLIAIIIRHRDLTGACFNNADISQGVFRGNVEECSFQNAYLEYANFKYCLIKNVNFSNANLHYATFENAKITGVDFRGAWFKDTDFRGAIIEDCIGLPDFDGDKLFN